MSEMVKTQRLGAVFEITLNRPEARNAFNESMHAELSQAFERAEREFHRGARVVLLRGAGRVFSAGIDLKQFLTFDESLRENLFPVTQRLQALADQVERSSLPVICVLQGYCLGLGLELALACDFRIAAERTKLGLPETRLGIIPDVGGTTRLVKLIGMAKTKDLVLTGRHIEAAEALEWGLLNAVYRKAELEKGVAQLVKSLVASAPLAVSYAKRVINDIADNPRGLHIEAWAQAQLFRTSDFQRAIEAMLSKQYPIDWEGK